MSSDSAKRLSRIDLNLLVTFDILLRELNVTRAAQEMCVSQSTMSYSLQRLRDTLGDPLFTRSAKGLVPTRKALELGRKIPPLLHNIDSILNEDEFEPMECDQTFSIALPVYLSSIIVPRLAEKLSKIAPKVNLVELPIKSNQIDQLEKGLIDYSVYYESARSKHFKTQLVGYLSACLFARAGHPIFSIDSPSTEEIFQYPIAGMQVESSADQVFKAPIDQLIAQLDTRNKGMIRGTQTQTLIDIMLQSDTILFGASVLQGYRGSNESFKVVKPLQEWSVPMNLIQHVRNVDNEAHIWFESLLVAEIEGALNHSSQDQ